MGDAGYGAPEIGDARAQAAAARFCSLAFGGSEEACVEWLRDTAGYENLRVLRGADGGGDDGILASLIVIPMGQYFGGRSVEMEGVAGVAVPPEGRGRGAGLELMRAQVVDAAARGVPLSCLYCSTQALYRQVGYEQAGVLCQTTLPLRTVGVRERGMVVRELTEADQPAVEACYARFAARHNGMLDRGGYIWKRTRSSRGEVRRGFGIFVEGAGGAPGGLEAYLRFAQRRKESTGRHDVAVSDLAFATVRGGRRLLGFLSDLATVGDDAVFDGPAVHPLMALLPQQYFASRFVDAWMLRLNLVKEAIESRGYVPSVRAAFVVEVEDGLVGANAGAWRVRVEDGRASVERVSGGGLPVVRCDVRGLAAVYAGYCSATSAAGLGWMDGDAGALAVVDGVFAGDGGWMVDRF
ncbi:MAG: enhanced intracellular survival protein Eis [Phycisphaerales bacterium JB041]